MHENAEVLKLDYEQTLATYRQLTEIRFRLLAFVPAISGAAIVVLGQTGSDPWAKFGVAVLGFFVTLGIVLYDQRNTQIYQGTIGQAKHLENKLGLETDTNAGLFGSRGELPTQHFFWFPFEHGLGLALVYSTVLGAWVFAAIESGWPTKTPLATTSRDSGRRRSSRSIPVARREAQVSQEGVEVSQEGAEASHEGANVPQEGTEGCARFKGEGGGAWTPSDVAQQHLAPIIHGVPL